jgi:hypothetical protein
VIAYLDAAQATQSSTKVRLKTSAKQIKYAKVERKIG